LAERGPGQLILPGACAGALTGSAVPAQGFLPWPPLAEILAGCLLIAALAAALPAWFKLRPRA